MTVSTRRECPDCGSHDTERVHTEWLTAAVEETRICNDCPTQYTLSFGRPVVESTWSSEDVDGTGESDIHPDST